MALLAMAYCMHCNIIISDSQDARSEVVLFNHASVSNMYRENYTERGKTLYTYVKGEGRPLTYLTQCVQ